MNIGYARVSTDEQRLELQIAALEAANCDTIYQDHGASGSHMERPGLERALASLSNGDHFVVWRLDRLGRSLSGVIKTVDFLSTKEVEFRSLTEGFDTSSNSGRLLFHVMAALAEFERNLISERTRAGMLAAANKGKHLGRPPALSPQQMLEISQELKNGSPDILALSERFRVSRRTIDRYIRRLEERV